MTFVRIAALILALVVSGTCAAASADEAGIRQALQSKLKMTVDSVAPTPFPGVYEVVLNGQIFYTDAKVSFMFKGDLIDMRGMEPKNLTEEAGSKLAASMLAKSTDMAVKRVRGNGKRVVYTFEDPNCGYCKELQKELAKVNDVTIYTFLWPILSQDSIDKSKAIWCAKDRARAWDDFMLKGVSPGTKRDCDTTALERNQRLAQRFGLRGTPAVYLGNGDHVGGFLPADRLEAALAANR